MGQGLRAGVREAGVRPQPAPGVVPGGTMAPGLAHIVLHQVLDAGLEQEVQPRLKGRSVRIRFAEDWGIGGAREADARKIMAGLPKRFARYGLTIHPTQTALMAFRKPAGPPGATPRPGTCAFLGLTPSWTTARRGGWVIKRRPARTRFRRTQQSWWRWCRANRHAPWQDPYQMGCRQWRGQFG
jgi:RNA-directed DNA polymerase